MAVANCKRCKAIYKKVYSPYCSGCYQMHMQNFSRVYRYLQERSNAFLFTLEELATNCQIPLAEIEEMYYTGELGTASLKIQHCCQRCNVAIAPVQRRGRFCPKCADKVGQQAGLDAGALELPELEEGDDLSFNEGRRRRQRFRKHEAEEIADIFNREIEAVKNESPLPIIDPKSYGFKRNCS